MDSEHRMIVGVFVVIAAVMGSGVAHSANAAEEPTDSAAPVEEKRPSPWLWGPSGKDLSLWSVAVTRKTDGNDEELDGVRQDTP